jgi:AraC-like DNA-binding protein
MNYKIDLFAIFIFLGIVQAVLLSFFFFSKNNRKVPSNVYQGLLVLSIAACSLEILLCYTGYILQCLWLVDYSESLSFFIAPSFYLMISSIIKGKWPTRWFLHFIPAVIWLILQIPFLVQSSDVKFNAWIGAYHPSGLTFRAVEENFFNPPYQESFFSPPYHSEFVLVHLSIYLILGFVLIGKTFKEKKQSFWRTQQNLFKRLRSATLQTAIVIVIIFIVKLLNLDDTGDHLFAAYMSLPIYFVSFQILRESGFFKQQSIDELQKYKSSSLSLDDQSAILEKLKSLIQSEKPFLKSNFSLPELAAQLKISTHQLSQVINDGLGKSFFEMTAEYRVEEAKQLLKDQPNIKVEEIAEQVGYNSKSSFNTAFKKIVGVTPSVWRASSEKQKRG